jgi:HEAT repeat protein
MKTFCGFLMVIILAAGSIHAEDTLAVSIYQRGIDALLKKRWDEAREAFTDVVRNHPKSPWSGGAEVYLCGIKEWTGASGDEVFDCYQAFLKAHPNGTWADLARRNMIGTARRMASAGNSTYQSYLRRIEQSGDEKMQFALLEDWPGVPSDSLWRYAARVYDTSPYPMVRMIAAFRLEHQKDARAVRKLIQIARKDPDAHVRVTAISSLGRIGNDEAVPVLVAIVRSDDVVEVRKAALSTLAKLRAETAIPFYLEWAANPDAGASRAEAVSAIGVMRSEEAGKALRQLLRESPYPDVRRAVLAQYVGRQSGSPVGLIEKLLKTEKDIHMRVTAVAALGIRGNDAGVPVLLDVLNGKDPEKVKSTARLALSQIGTAKAMAALDGVGKEK